jgi:hypothetical protein
MNLYRGIGGLAPLFLMSILLEDESIALRAGRFNSGENTSCSHRRAGWVKPRDGLDVSEKIKSLDPAEI